MLAQQRGPAAKQGNQTIGTNARDAFTFFRLTQVPAAFEADQQADGEGDAQLIEALKVLVNRFPALRSDRDRRRDNLPAARY